MKFYVDYALSLYVTEVIEADSVEDARAIVNRIDEAGSEEFDERLMRGFRIAPIMLENMETIDIVPADDSNEVTLTAEDIAAYTKE